MKPDIYQTITDRFIRQLEQGTVPWQRPWISAQNMISCKPYQGINTLILACENRESPHWLSYKQAHDLGGTVKKGERGTPVIYWQLLERKDANGVAILDASGRPERLPFIRWSNVFNLEQCENIKAPELSKAVASTPPLERAQAIVDKSFVQIDPNSQRDMAFYLPALDRIEVPSIERFPNRSEYYHTLFHEMSHATGSKNRLNREGIAGHAPFGTPAYAKEELIAELGAAFTSNEAGILQDCTFQNSASYVKNWISALEDNPRMLISAGSAAQKASDYICNEASRENPLNHVRIMLDKFAVKSTAGQEAEHER